MAVARLGYEIDSSGAVKAASDLDKMSKSARIAETQQGALKSATAELNSLTGKASTEFIRLKASEDSAFAAAVKLKQAQDLLTAELKAGSITADQHAASLSNLSARYQSQIAVVDKTGRAYAGAGVNMRMLLPQFSQIGQQFTATGQLGQAVAVQLADIGLAFGAIGTVVGAVAGVALPSLINAFYDGVDEAERFKDELNTLNDVISNLSSSNDLLELSVDELTDRFGEQAAVVRNLIEMHARWNVSIARSSLKESADLAKYGVEQYTRLAEANRLASIEVEELKNQQNEFNAAFTKVRIDEIARSIAADAQDMADQFGISADQAVLLSQAFSDFASANTTKQMNSELADLDKLMQDLGISTDAIPDSLSEAIGRMAELGILTAELEQSMLKAAEAASFMPGLNPSMPVNSLLPPSSAFGTSRRGGGGKSEAERLREEMQRRLDTLNESLTSETLLKMQQYSTDLETLKWALDQEKITREQYKDELEILRVDAWGSDFERQRLQYEMEQNALQAALDNKIISEEEYQRRIRTLRQSNDASGLSIMQDFFGEAEGLMQSGNDKLFKIGQAAAIANAVVNGHSAAVAAWDKGMQAGGPPLAAAFTALSLARTGAQISAIKSASSAGSGSGTSSSAGVTATSSNSPAAAPQEAIIQLEGAMADVLAPLMDGIISELQSRSDSGVNIVGVSAG